MKFGDLKIGDVMTLADTRAVVLAIQKPHPLNPNFHLIIWWIFNEKRISFDMLHPAYDLIPGTGIVDDGKVSWSIAVAEAIRA